MTLRTLNDNNKGNDWVENDGDLPTIEKSRLSSKKNVQIKKWTLESTLLGGKNSKGTVATKI